MGMYDFPYETNVKHNEENIELKLSHSKSSK